MPKVKFSTNKNVTKNFVPKYLSRLINKKRSYWKLFRKINLTFYKHKHHVLNKLGLIVREGQVLKVKRIQTLVHGKNYKIFLNQTNNFLGRKLSKDIRIKNETTEY